MSQLACHNIKWRLCIVGSTEIPSFLKDLPPIRGAANSPSRRLSRSGAHSSCRRCEPGLIVSICEKVGPELLTLYEVAEYDGDRHTLERAIEAMNSANGEIELLIRHALRTRALAYPSTDRMLARSES